MSEWKPMNAAPMDGTLVIGFDPCAKTRKIKFMKYVKYEFYHDSWMCDHGRPLIPTLWQPMLKSPV